jgi:SAM-dependent methyltransferase
MRLLGIDMSLAELGAARTREPTAQLVCAVGQALPLPDASVDCVVSHLAFMLMSDIDEVCREIERVLRPRGRFATVTGGGPGDGDAFELFLELFRPLYAASPIKAPRIGDKRTRHAGVIAELFGPGFDAPTESVHLLRLDGPVEQVWEALSGAYECFVLDADAFGRLHAGFTAEAAGLTDSAGVLPCTMRVRCVELTKR